MGASRRFAPPMNVSDRASWPLAPNRDREGPHGLPPPTPPDLRVTSPAVRQIESGYTAPPPARRLPACQPRVHPNGRASPDPANGRDSLDRSGLPIGAGGPMPAAAGCGAVRADSSALRPQQPGHPAALPGSAVIPSGPRRRIDQARPNGGWRALRSRARSPRADYTSYPVRVPRPARSFHAAFRPHLAVTPVRVPGPAAPRTPGQGPCTPKPDRMHGTHA